MRVDVSLPELTITVADVPDKVNGNMLDDLMQDIADQVELGLIAITDSIHEKFGTAMARDKYKVDFSIETSVK